MKAPTDNWILKIHKRRFISDQKKMSAKKIGLNTYKAKLNSNHLL